MNINIKKLEYVYIVLHNIIRFLEEKNDLLLGETRHIKRSLNTIINNEEQATSTQFNDDCEVLLAGIKSLIDKLEEHAKAIDNEITIIRLSKSNSDIYGNQYLEKILLFDCMRERGYSFANKLEYFYRAYENLISSHRDLYIPTPSISRRVKTSNLMLYFNKTINKEYQYLSDNFFKIKFKDNQEKPKIISTWSFSPTEHLKTFDNLNNQYISFSFWFFEKQYFYPIAFHEIAHALYTHNNNNNFKLDSQKAVEITNKLYFSNGEKSFHLGMVHTIYQDIIADLSAYVISGESYIHALFYTGFMRGINRNFYKDLDEESLISGNEVEDSKRTCLEKEKNMTLLTWRNIDDDFISFFVRIQILIKMHKKIISSDNITIELQGILDILEIVYPKHKKNYDTFEDIVSITESHKRDYTREKSFVLLASHLFNNVIFSNSALVDSIIRLRHDKNETSKDALSFLQKEVLDKYLEEKVFIPKNTINSYYDLVWMIRFSLIDHKSIPSGRVMRLNNIYQLGIFENSLEPIDLRHVIYELIFFKFNKHKNPLPEFKNNFNNLKDIDWVSKVNYAFGPYDMVCLSKKTTSCIDEKLEKFDKENKFFTERHALYKLENYVGCNKGSGQNKPRYIDLIVTVSMKKEFIANSKKNNNSGHNDDFESLRKCILGCTEHYNTARLFISMGNENFLIYFQGIYSNDINNITKSFYEYRTLFRSIYSTILLNQRSVDNQQNKFHKDIGFEGGNIILLCKLRNLYTLEIEVGKEIKAKMAKFNLGTLYKLYGVFDYKIVINNKEDIFNKISDFLVDSENLFADTQLEYQPEIFV